MTPEMTVWVEELACFHLVGCENEHHRLRLFVLPQRAVVDCNTASIIKARTSPAGLRLDGNPNG